MAPPNRSEQGRARQPPYRTTPRHFSSHRWPQPDSIRALAINSSIVIFSLSMSALSSSLLSRAPSVLIQLAPFPRRECLELSCVVKLYLTLRLLSSPQMWAQLRKRKATMVSFCQTNSNWLGHFPPYPWRTLGLVKRVVVCLLMDCGNRHLRVLAAG